MTTDEIKKVLEKNNVSICDFAKELGIGYSTLRAVLSGKNPLTKQLEKHIALLINAKYNTRAKVCNIEIKVPEKLTAIFEAHLNKIGSCLCLEDFVKKVIADCLQDLTITKD